MPQDEVPLSKRDPFGEIIEEFGPPDGGGPIDAQDAERYEGRVPDGLIDFWRTHGRGTWRNGFVWLCDPEPLMPIIETLFRNDPEFDSALMVPYLRDAFGQFHLWHPTLKLVTVDVHLGEVTTTDITGVRPSGKVRFDDNLAVASPVNAAVFDGRGWVDNVTGQAVFDDVYKRLGPVAQDQAYVMSPHFRLGGTGVAEDFSIGGLVEYLGFLVQLGPFTRTRYIDPKDGGRGPYGHVETVRTIGHSTL
ncbi:GAD-like domain-containing protein, partial [Marivita sp. S0852]|uniref:GAD-like domain-containing protein n=1 Tax=Marivita sp. S0852 TaxID=3373893 RepID=UPI0039829243